MQYIINQIIEFDQRLDIISSYLIKNTGVTINRSTVNRYLDNYIKVNGKYRKKSYKVQIGDVLEIDIESIKRDLKSKDQSLLLSELCELDIIYENTNYLVINKPSGMVVHPGINNYKGTLANYIKGYLEQKGEYNSDLERAGIVHRLDKGVSGVMIIAKTREYQLYLKSLFENHKVIKIYHAKIDQNHGYNRKVDIDNIISQHLIDNKWDRIEGYMSRSVSNRKKMILSNNSNGKKAVSYIYLYNNNEVLIRIMTGRMHQVRATLKYLGYTIQGDALYSRKSGTNSNMIALKSIYLSFRDTDGVQKSYKVY